MKTNSWTTAGQAKDISSKFKITIALPKKFGSKDFITVVKVTKI